MSFTVKTIFPPTPLSDEDVRKHRLTVGRNIRNSWKARFGTLPLKVEEDAFQVFEYPAEFKNTAETIVKRYLIKYNLPVKPKRKRIQAQKYQEIAKF